MISDNKLKIVIVVATTALGFVVGRETASKNLTEVKQTAVEHDDSKKHTQITTTTTKAPNGEVKTITTTDIVAVGTKDKAKSKETSIQTAGPKINLSVLLGVDIHDPAIPLYGIAINKEMLGPVTFGVWALTNGTAGLSAGVNF